MLELAESHPIDIFILFLNNILFHDGDIPVEDRMRKALCLISDLKAKYGTPIIALCAFQEYAQQAEEAGADRFFKAPFELDKFRQGFEGVPD